MSETRTETREPRDEITTTTTIVLDWKERLRVLFGARIGFQVTNEVIYTGSEFGPFRARVTGDRLWTWFDRPRWVRKKIGGESPVSQADRLSEELRRLR